MHFALKVKIAPGGEEWFDPKEGGKGHKQCCRL